MKNKQNYPLTWEMTLFLLTQPEIRKADNNMKKEILSFIETLSWILRVKGDYAQ